MTHPYKKPNRLASQKSPYLLQHAYNPVDWYPWGQEAFDDAKKYDRPIFLSIGYATCHWCHVMESESFENEELAEVMNKTFINIKVDKEELPEVDNLYMEFAQSMMSGSAGWPLNLVLTPSLEPFFAATYLPLHQEHGLLGMIDLVRRIKDLWEGSERENVIQQASKIVQIFREYADGKGSEIPDKEVVNEVMELIYQITDPIYGGMKGEPKFPIGHLINFQLRYAKNHQDSRAIFLAEKNLEMMQRGGIFDHLGGGFSRYSVDENWLVPHFEKMLLDNALLASSYLEGWQATQKEGYRITCQNIIDYVLREMRHPLGGFYSAEDADSEGEEGKFYTWTYEEIVNILGEDNGKFFIEYFNVTPKGNFHGKNILHYVEKLDQFASDRGIELQELETLFERQKKILWNVRESRVHPAKDDKIITSWNGLMIHALVEAGSAFSNPNYLQAAVECATFIQNNLWKNNRLHRRWRDGEAMHPGNIEDYAFLIKGLLTLFDSGVGIHCLEWAVLMTNILKEKFKIPGGGYYQSDGSDPNLLIRKCLYSDGAEPSGNAVHCENLLRLYQYTLNSEFLTDAEDVFKGVLPHLQSYGPGYGCHVMNLMRYYDQHAPTLLIALNQEKQFKKEIQHLISANLIPHKAVIWRYPDDSRLFDYIPYAEDQVPLDNKTTLYVCHHGVCHRPVTDISEITEVITRL